MKKVEDIFNRIICIYVFCERIFLEENNLEGIYFSSNDREDKRRVMIKWLNEKGYTNHLTNEEREIINTPVSSLDYTIRKKYNRYEAIEPLLWCLGLISRTSSYDKYVTSDFSRVLQIGAAHNIENLIKISSLRSEQEIINKREVSMLWNWRSKLRDLNDDIDKVIINIFGKEYKKHLKMKMSNSIPKDFIAFNEPYHKLSKDRVAQLEDIVEWRHHAYEWVLSDEDWDNVPISM